MNHIQFNGAPTGASRTALLRQSLPRINTGRANDNTDEDYILASPASDSMDVISVSSLETDFEEISHGEAEEATLSGDVSEDRRWEEASAGSEASRGVGEVIEFWEDDANSGYEVDLWGFDSVGDVTEASNTTYAGNTYLPGIAAPPPTRLLCHPHPRCHARATPRRLPRRRSPVIPARRVIPAQLRAAFDRIQQEGKRLNALHFDRASMRFALELDAQGHQAVRSARSSSEGIRQYLQPVEASLGRWAVLPMQVVAQAGMVGFLMGRGIVKAYAGCFRLGWDGFEREVGVRRAEVMFWVTGGEGYEVLRI
ncbi:hypothetical protein B0T16DRAFT_459995 [Cercophora newfieldiana]|uniref:Uncharacterized protein n=1 Tax=Cercophora newfieldiana TaxID=92897 RepID=A0AA39Y1W4_9PEZI|nr:hypothetical protein B0T16DRAFT_459995 [Cercophora newfieldiana]